MLGMFVAALLGGCALGLRLMLGGVLSNALPTEVRGGAPAPRARARLLSPVVAAMLTGFGLTGAVLTRTTFWSGGVRLLVALSAAAVATALAGWVRRWALDPDAPAASEDDPRFSLQGLPALVTRAIAAARAGEISWRQDGYTQVAIARAINGAALSEGTEVVIDHLEDGVAWVESWQQVEARL